MQKSRALFNELGSLYMLGRIYAFGKITLLMT